MVNFNGSELGKALLKEKLNGLPVAVAAALPLKTFAITGAFSLSDLTGVVVMLSKPPNFTPPESAVETMLDCWLVVCVSKEDSFESDFVRGVKIDPLLAMPGVVDSLLAESDIPEKMPPFCSGLLDGAVIVDKTFANGFSVLGFGVLIVGLKIEFALVEVFNVKPDLPSIFCVGATFAVATGLPNGIPVPIDGEPNEIDGFG